MNLALLTCRPVSRPDYRIFPRWESDLKNRWKTVRDTAIFYICMAVARLSDKQSPRINNSTLMTSSIQCTIHNNIIKAWTISLSRSKQTNKKDVKWLKLWGSAFFLTRCLFIRRYSLLLPRIPILQNSKRERIYSAQQVVIARIIFILSIIQVASLLLTDKMTAWKKEITQLYVCSLLTVVWQVK